MPINNTWFMRGYKAGKSGRYLDMYEGWNKAKGKPNRDKNMGKYIDAQEFFYEGFLDGQRSRESNPSIETDWIPVHAIRKLPDGSIQLLTEKGTLSNPSKRKSFMGKVRRLFSKNPSSSTKLKRYRVVKTKVGYGVKDIFSGKLVISEVDKPTAEYECHLLNNSERESKSF